jgi:hypothetical protein
MVRYHSGGDAALSNTVWGVFGSDTWSYDPTKDCSFTSE